MLVGVGAVVGAGVAGVAVQANAISATSASDMAVSNRMAVVYTAKAWKGSILCRTIKPLLGGRGRRRVWGYRARRIGSLTKPAYFKGTGAN